MANFKKHLGNILLMALNLNFCHLSNKLLPTKLTQKLIRNLTDFWRNNYETPVCLKESKIPVKFAKILKMHHNLFFLHINILPYKMHSIVNLQFYGFARKSVPDFGLHEHIC